MNEQLSVACLALKKALENDEAVHRYQKLVRVRIAEERARRLNPFTIGVKK